ncbi:MAG: DUF4870 family protein [Gammaproteobacteria bacterium]
MATTAPLVPAPGLVRVTHVMYALHAATVLIGLSSTVLIITAFVFGWPSILAVVINYVKRAGARGTWLDSHFSWQLRTFWWALLWLAIVGLFAVTIVGLVVAVPLAGLVGLWVAYRVIRGWLALVEGRELPA